MSGVAVFSPRVRIERGPNGATLFTNLAMPGSVYGTFAGSGALTFAVTDTASGLRIGNGSNGSSPMSHAVFGTMAPGGAFMADTNGGQFDDILGLNDSGAADGDCDDLVVGIRVATIAAVPEPQTYAVLLAGLAAGGFICLRREPRRC